MPNILHSEFENENRMRKYPFTDASSLLGSSGYQLDNSAFIDLSILARDGVERAYLSQLTADEAVFSDYYGNELGRAAVVQGYSPLYDVSGFQVGAVVFGDIAKVLPEGGDILFERTVEIVAQCLIPIPSVGVAALVPENGTPVSGDVVIAGETGVRTSCRVEAGVSILRVDFIGVAEAEDPCTTGPRIKTLCVEIWEGAAFAVADNDSAGTISVSYGGSSLTEVCANKKFGKLPDADGNLPTSALYHDDLGRTAADVPARIQSLRRLVHSFEIDVATVLGAVTFVSYVLPDENPTRLQIRKVGASSVEFSLLGE